MIYVRILAQIISIVALIIACIALIKKPKIGAIKVKVQTFTLFF